MRFSPLAPRPSSLVPSARGSRGADQANRGAAIVLVQELLQAFVREDVDVWRQGGKRRPAYR